MLFNFSPSDVEIVLTDHFCTLVLHDVKHRSYLSPNNTRSVLEKYVNTYKEETSKIFEYTTETTEIIREYKKKVNKVESITNKNKIFLQIYLFFDLIKQNKWMKFKIIAPSVIFIIFIAALCFKPKIGELIDQNTQNTIYLLGSLGSFISAVIAISNNDNKSKS